MSPKNAKLVVFPAMLRVAFRQDQHQAQPVVMLGRAGQHLEALNT